MLPCNLCNIFTLAEVERSKTEKNYANNFEKARKRRGPGILPNGGLNRKVQQHAEW